MIILQSLEKETSSCFIAMLSETSERIVGELGIGERKSPRWLPEARCIRVCWASPALGSLSRVMWGDCCISHNCWNLEFLGSAAMPYGLLPQQHWTVLSSFFAFKELISFFFFWRIFAGLCVFKFKEQLYFIEKPRFSWLSLGNLLQ